MSKLEQLIQLIIKSQEKGMFRIGDSMPPVMPVNMGLPAGILSQFSTEVIENILQDRSAEKIIGPKFKALDFEEEDYYNPFVETLGQTSVYGDYMDNLVSDINVSFNRQGHYLFSALWRVGEREREKLAKAKINADQYKMLAVSEALAIEFNRTAFFGFMSNTGNKFLVNGLINDPNLLPAISANSTILTMTDEQIIGFFASAVGRLSEQTGNHITPNSKIRVGIPSDIFTALSGRINQYGLSIIEQIKKGYPNLELISSIELVNAVNNQSMMVFIGESNAGGVSDTMRLGYSEIMRMSNVVISHNNTSQVVTTGTIGTLVLKPVFVVRYINV